MLDMSKQQDIENVKESSAVFVIFGATGDLAQKRIFPALIKLSKSDLLPEKFKIIACARTKYSTEEFIKTLGKAPKIEAAGSIASLSSKITYLSLDLAQNLNLKQIVQEIDNFEKQTNTCPSRIFYMAVSPAIFEQSFENFAKNNLHLGCRTHQTKPRVIIEKPFGRDLKSAQNIGSALSKYFESGQIYRIDHYLGKETVQNIFAFRFANELFEPVWNNKYIDHIQITTAEHIGVEKRGEFYDQTGALRDIVQNHLLQLVCLITMDAPESFNAEDINVKKIEILKNIKKMTPAEIQTSTIRGQYEGFLQEEKINPKSQTESYSLVKLAIENQRWQGVPFYLRTGKKLTGKVTSIIIQFKEKGHRLFENFWEKPLPNHITIQIQPNEGIGIRLAAKKPGLAASLEPVDMEFCYKTSFDTPQPEAYERLLMDVMLGDQSLFLAQDIVEESWKIIDPIREVWQSGKPPLVTYKTGSWGPKEADDLIKKDGRQWLAPLLTICKI
jgi:glucose-6-phosphate 1-dehydrogenase